MDAYEECLKETSSEDAPWFVVPADDKQNARLIISQSVLDTLASLKLSYPETTPERRQQLLALREQLEKSEEDRNGATAPSAPEFKGT